MDEIQTSPETPALLTSARTAPQIKICGLTDKREAVACALLGASAVGFVFYTGSPRAVTAGKAWDISALLPRDVCRVGVFVDASFETILKTAQAAGLHAVQLHGRESPRTVEALTAEGFLVVKTLFSSRAPFIREAHRYPGAAFLVERGGGPLPGGNAEAWDFSRLQGFVKKYPLILAGGLSTRNIGEAINQSQPDAVDISSGVEKFPGRKDIKRIQTFIRAVRRTPTAISRRRIFHVDP